MAASSSWTIVRIWFGITNKLRITGASTKVLTTVTLYYCTLKKKKLRITGFQAHKVLTAVTHYYCTFYKKQKAPYHRLPNTQGVVESKLVMSRNPVRAQN